MIIAKIGPPPPKHNVDNSKNFGSEFMHTATLYRGEGEILEILLFCLLINFQDCNQPLIKQNIINKA